MNSKLSGPLLIGLACLLWSTDALIRYPAIQHMNPLSLVFLEHLFCMAVLLLWIYFKGQKNLFSLSPLEWLAAAVCGLGGSALATLLFSASFTFMNPSIAILLQKFQPLLVVLIAYLFLGEKLAKNFFIWGSLALAAGIVLSFPSLNFSFMRHGLDLHTKGVQYALAAATIWAISTVFGKVLVKNVATFTATFWRMAFGTIGSLILMCLTQDHFPWHVLNSAPTLLSLCYLGLVPGFLAIFIYYKGLAKTQANVTSFIELLFPIGSVFLNTIFLHTPLEPVQLIAGGVLLFAVTMISF